MTQFKTILSITALVVTAGLLGAGCSSFHHNWRQAGGNPSARTDLQGRWQGRWHSDSNGHEGKLRCIVTKLDEGNYQARFHAKYLKVLSFGYTVPLKIERSGDLFNFRGEANLGRLAGGVYHYDGHADTTNFFATYTSKYDHGTFQMVRP